MLSIKPFTNSMVLSVYQQIKFNIMKKVVLALLLMVGAVTFAQQGERKPKLSPEEMADKRVEKLKSELQLNENQVAQLRDLTKKQMETRKVFQEERKAKKEAAQRDRKELMQQAKQRMDEERKANDEAMKKILTEEQYKKWVSIREEKIEQAKERKQERKAENRKPKMKKE